MQQLAPHPIPAHLSYSQVSTILECGERYRLERIFKVPQQPSWALVGGGAEHAGTELFDLWVAGGDDTLFELQRLTTAGRTQQVVDSSQGQGSEPGTSPAGGRPARGATVTDNDMIEKLTELHQWWVNTPSVDGDADVASRPVPPPITALANRLMADEIRSVSEDRRTPDAYRDPDTWKASGRATKEWPNKEDREWWTHHLPIFLHRYIEWRRTSGFTLAHIDDRDPAVEMDVTGWLGEVQAQAFLDRIMLDPGGTPAVVDIKTSSREPVSAEQLGLYSVLLELRGLPKPQLGYFWMARTGDLGEPHDLSEYTRDYFDWKYTEVAKQRNAGKLFANPQSTFCSSCGVREFCYAKDGARKNEVPRPWQTSSPELREYKNA